MICFIVIERLSLVSSHAGQTIKQKTPANEQGMAYGYIKMGKLGKKTYGFYPASLVVLKVKSQKTKNKKTKETVSETSSTELEESGMSNRCERTFTNFGVERTDSTERLSLRKIAFVYEELTESPCLNSKRLAKMKVSPSIPHRTFKGLDKDT